MKTLDLYAGHNPDTDRIGQIRYEAGGPAFDFDYAPEWLCRRGAWSLSPRLSPDRLAAMPAGERQRELRAFFANLLPEGRRLAQVAALLHRRSDDIPGLLTDTGSETAGALRFGKLPEADVGEPFGPDVLRELPSAELSQRIAWRDSHNFAAWDDRTYGSLSGRHDKIAVHIAEGRWYLVTGQRLASTHIVKVGATDGACTSLASNEYLCTRIASVAGVPTADCDLRPLGSGPVLVTARFDRQVRSGSRLVRRVHTIDGCQLLGLEPSRRGQWPHGNGRDVLDLHPGASLAALFFALREHAADPDREILRLLRWAILQVLLGNTEAHAKNVCLLVDAGDALRVAPAYDLLSLAPFAAASGAPRTMAMAVGGCSIPAQMNRIHWRALAAEAGVEPLLVDNELRRMARRILNESHHAIADLRSRGGDLRVAEAITDFVRMQCETALSAAPLQLSA